MKFGEISLFANSSQTIGPEELKYAWFNGGQPGMVMRNFGEEKIKTLTMGIFSLQNFQVVVITLCLSRPSHLIQYRKHIDEQNCVQITSSIFFFNFFSSPEVQASEMR